MKRDRIKWPAAAGLFLAVTAFFVGAADSADLVIRIPGDLSQQDGYYRLYYKPEVGSPQVRD